jgi:hypothetical protein
MATLTATRASSTLGVFQPMGSGAVAAAYGSYDFAANPTAADIVQLCRVPAGAVILGGWMRLEDIDSNATETVDIDIGWAANGGSGTYDAVDADGLGNFGVRTGDAVTDYLPEGGSLLPLHGLLKDGFITFTRETLIQATVVAASATFAAGTLSVVVLYVKP